MKKLLVFIGAIVWAASVGGFSMIAFNRAMAEAAEGSGYQIDCNPTPSSKNCHYMELTNEADWVGDVYVPTILYVVVSLALIATVIKLLRYRADPSLAGSSGDK